MGRVPKSIPKDVRRDQDRSRTPLEPGHTLYAMHLFTNVFHAYAKWKAWTMWLMEQTRQVSQEGAIIGPRVVVRSVLVQEARTRVLGSARTSQITTSHVAAHPIL
jgi:hypothetical protein